MSGPPVTVALLVEGESDVGFFRRLCDSRQLSGCKVLAYDGVDKLPGYLEAFLQSPDATGGSLKSLAVIRDADDSGARALQSAKDVLRRLGLPVPTTHAALSEPASPYSFRTAVFILPDASSSGALETLCYRAWEDPDRKACAEQFLDCLVNRRLDLPAVQDKVRVGAYLASLKRPCFNLGQAANRSVIDFDSAEFAPLVSFLQLLSNNA